MKLNLKYILTASLHSTWLFLIVILFIIANRVSYLHAFIFPDLNRFAIKFSQILLFDYFLDILTSFAGAALFSLACIGIGLITLRTLKLTGTGLATGVTAFASGQIIFSLLFLSIISLTRLTASLTVAVFGLSVIVSIKPIKDFCAEHIKISEIGRLGDSQKRITFISFAFLFLSLFLTSARLGYDSVSDYFSQAKLMALSYEATSFFPENYMIVSSLHPGILFTVVMQLFGDQAARMLSWANGFAILITTYLIAKENNASFNARIYIMALLMSSTFFIDLLGDGKVELISTTPILIGIYWMQKSMSKPSKGVFLLIGLLAGFAIISRLYNIFLVSFYIFTFYLIGLVKVYLKEKQTDTSASWRSTWSTTKPVLWILPTLILIGMYHLWQNWLWLGSPFAPIEFAPKLRSTNWEWQFDPDLLNTYRILYPLTITIFNSPQSLGTISPLFLGFLPILIIKKIQTRISWSRDLVHSVATSLLTLLLWVLLFYTVVEIRYVLFIWVMLFIPTGILIDSLLSQETGVISAISRFTIVSVLAFIILRMIVIAVDTYSPVENNGQARCSDISFCTFFSPMNEIAKPGDRVFSLNAFRYYFRNDLFVCSSRSTEYEKLKHFAQENSPEFWTELYRQGYGFVAYENNFSVYHSRFGTIPSHSIAPAWLKVEVISSEHENLLYQLTAQNPPYEANYSCQKNALGEWQLIMVK